MKEIRWFEESQVYPWSEKRFSSALRILAKFSMRALDPEGSNDPKPLKYREKWDCVESQERTRMSIVDCCVVAPLVFSNHQSRSKQEKSRIAWKAGKDVNC
jgi:hypothetical protein